MTPGRIFKLVACVLLGVALGFASAATGIHPITLAMGTAATALLIACTFAPLFIDLDKHYG